VSLPLAVPGRGDVGRLAIVAQPVAAVGTDDHAHHRRPTKEVRLWNSSMETT